ncbi:cupin domain-containing protein [Caballeronia novacaledonica]|uniref:cupin domain-containing protein n=1 Tax=Caballeronia novacaledonica TaxID=1544861 RepID=UPI001EE183F6|nr:cupin domain-containing protein [Caballeronia novacaledonica]GJH13324.1 cupin domain-containing protein [Caballeronia novacaledonica]
MNIRSIARAAGTAMAFAIAVPASAHSGTETVTPNFQHAIPNVPGKSLTAIVVDYPAGAASPAHRHAGSAFTYAYVVSGEVESQVDDGQKRVYHAGESFFEEPGAVHRISRNASKTRPAKLLAVFIADSNDQALTIPVK